MCPLVSISHSRSSNWKINRLHECCLRVIHEHWLYEVLLEKDGSVSFRIRNLQIYATKIYKASKGLSLSILTELFKDKDEQYNLRNNAECIIPAIRTVYHGSESISFVAAKIWSFLPNRLKNTNNLEIFKTEIKKWNPENLTLFCSVIFMFFLAVIFTFQLINIWCRKLT